MQFTLSSSRGKRYMLLVKKNTVFENQKSAIENSNELPLLAPLDHQSPLLHFAYDGI